MDVIALDLERRSERGGANARRLRRAGRVPGVVYGRKSESIPVSAESVNLATVLRAATRGNVMLDLKIPGESGAVKAIFREVQLDPVHDTPLHCDFQRISLDEKFHVKVHVHVVGVADGVKNFGGILDHHLREIELNCLPMEVPNRIDVDVTNLGIGDSFRVGDLKLEGIEILDDPQASILSVVPPTVLKEATTAAEGEGEGEGAEVAATAEGEGEPEVIKKSKKDEGEEPKDSKEKGK